MCGRQSAVCAVSQPTRSCSSTDRNGGSLGAQYAPDAQGQELVRQIRRLVTPKLLEPGLAFSLGFFF